MHQLTQESSPCYCPVNLTGRGNACFTIWTIIHYNSSFFLTNILQVISTEQKLYSVTVKKMKKTGS